VGKLGQIDVAPSSIVRCFPCDRIRNLVLENHIFSCELRKQTVPVKQTILKHFQAHLPETAKQAASNSKTWRLVLMIITLNFTERIVDHIKLRSTFILIFAFKSRLRKPILIHRFWEEFNDAVIRTSTHFNSTFLK